MNGFKKAVFAATMTLAGFATCTHAALIGDTITLTAPLFTETKKIDITGDAEFKKVKNFFNFDFSATQLTIDISQLPDNKFVFNDSYNFVFSGFDDVISNFEFVDSAPKFNKFSEANYSFDDHTITINLSGAEAQNKNSRIVFNIESAPSVPEVPVPGNSVPEPTTVALLGLGLLGFAASRRKSGKSANA